MKVFAEFGNGLKKTYFYTHCSAKNVYEWTVTNAVTQEIHTVQEDRTITL
jgi:hypothetical protein